MWYAELYRFGETLSVIAETEEQAKSALMEAYEKLYVSENMSDPREDVDMWGATYWESALEDIETTEYTVGVVRKPWEV